jgi:hypothetical protein
MLTYLVDTGASLSTVETAYFLMLRWQKPKLNRKNKKIAAKFLLGDLKTNTKI